MKILQLVTKRQYRGAEVFAYNLSQELINEGHQIIFAGLYKNKSDNLQLSKGINLDLLQEKPRFFSFKLLYKLYKLIKKEQPDIIQSNGSDTLKYAVIVSLFITRSTLVYRNISMISNWIKSPLKKHVYKLLFSKVDFVTSVGRFAMEDFIQTFNYSPHKIKVIRRGIPMKFYNKKQAGEELKKKFALNSNDFVVIHIGNFSPEKNHIFLIKVFEKIKQKRKDIKLLLVGKGNLTEYIKNEIIKRKLTDTVILAGFNKNTGPLLAGSDLLVLSSLVEGVPGVILEAAVQKTPTIAIDVGGVSEVVIHKQTGILIPRFSVDTFADEILRLKANPKLRKEMGNFAFQYVIKNYNKKQTVKEFIKLYQALLNVKN